MRKLIILSLCLTILMTNQAFSMDNNGKTQDPRTSVRPLRVQENQNRAPHDILEWSDLDPRNWHPLSQITVGLVIFNVGLVAYKYLFLDDGKWKCAPTTNISTGSHCEAELFLLKTIRNSTHTVCQYMLDGCSTPLNLIYTNSEWQ